jgi:hypothetical protein
MVKRDERLIVTEPSTGRLARGKCDGRPFEDICVDQRAIVVASVAGRYNDECVCLGRGPRKRRALVVEHACDETVARVMHACEGVVVAARLRTQGTVEACAHGRKRRLFLQVGVARPVMTPGARAPHAKPKPRNLSVIGPGIVSGASDNDPTTVATLAVIGSTTVYGLAWLVLLVIPMLAVIQQVAAHVGTVTKHGLEDCIRNRFGEGWASGDALGTAVNLITLAADLRP